MPAAARCALPADALLRSCAADGAYTDCYAVDVPFQVSHAEYVRAFYTTWLFKTERLILKWALSKSSSDCDAQRLAEGSASSFAAWDVERRGENQILLCDYSGATRSWLMTDAAGSDGTRLYFGSAVVASRRNTWPFRALLGFHKLYSVLLLASARRRLERWHNNN